MFTDPVVITGPVTNEELAQRSSIGLFVFVPRASNEELIVKAGFRIVSQLDATENAALVSRRWREARQRFRDDLLRIEGEERFEGVQKFLGAVHRLTSERRLSRIAYLVEKIRGNEDPRAVTTASAQLGRIELGCTEMGMSPSVSGALSGSSESCSSR